MNTYMIKSNSSDKTVEIGCRLGQRLEAGDLITLQGDLGAGKTMMSKGIAKGLGIAVPVSSPTFTIIKEYHQGRVPFYHFDLYRLGAGAIDEELGYEEYFFGLGVCVIEWSEFIEELIPNNSLQISIVNTNQDPSARQIKFSFDDAKWEPIIKELVTQCNI